MKILWDILSFKKFMKIFFLMNRNSKMNSLSKADFLIVGHVHESMNRNLLAKISDYLPSHHSEQSRSKEKLYSINDGLLSVCIVQ